jgi:hypothetical protein
MTIVYQTVTAGNSYSRTITSPNAISFVAENLPNGLSISNSGVISGILQQAGRFAITILTRGSGGTNAAILDLTVNAPSVPFITSSDVVTHEMATAFSYQITASSPTAILSYGATNLPNGLSVNTSTGLITGTPTTGSNDAIVVTTARLSATNSAGTGYQDLIFLLQQRPVITSSLASLKFASGFAISPYTITATKSPISFGASPLPSGLSINTNTGVISGTPVIPPGSSPQSTNIGLSAYNGYFTAGATLGVTVGIIPTITSASSKAGEMATAFSYQITASSPSAILSYGATNLPTGLSIDTNTGLITGTPTSASDDPVIIQNIQVSATNDYGVGSQNVTLSLTQRPVITSSLTPLTYVNNTAITPYTITASKSPTSFTASPLPRGLSLNASSGVISGTVATSPVGNQSIIPGVGQGARTPTRFYLDAYPQTLNIDTSNTIYMLAGTSPDKFKVSIGGTVSTITNNSGIFSIILASLNPSGNKIYIVTESSGTSIVSYCTFDGSTIGPATTLATLSPPAPFNSPIAVDSSENVYVMTVVSFRTQLSKITPLGVVTVLAGSSSTFPSGTTPTDGTGTSAIFKKVLALSFDSSSNLYMYDSGAVRKVTSSGVVTTIAGAWEYGNTDATGSSARFGGEICDLVVSSSNDIFINDRTNRTIRKVTQAGVVTTIAGGSSGVGDYRYINGTGTAARFASPLGLCINSFGDLYVADHRTAIRKITQAGVVTTFAGYSGDSGLNEGNGTTARFYDITSLTADSSNNLIVADSKNNKIRKITPSRDVTTFAGALGFSSSEQIDGPVNSARFRGENYMGEITRDSSNNVYVTAGNLPQYNVRKIDTSGNVSTLGVSSNAYYPPSVGLSDSSGNNYRISNYQLIQVSPTGVTTAIAGAAGQSGIVDGTGTSARIGAQTGTSGVIGVSISTGHVYFYDVYYTQSVFRKSTFAGAVTTYYSTILSNFPDAFTIDQSGNVYMAGSQASGALARQGHTIWKISPSGVLSVIFTSGEYQSRLNTPDTYIEGPSSQGYFYDCYKMTIDSSGNLYLLTEASPNTILKVTQAGELSVFAGTPGVSIDTTGTVSLSATNTVLTSIPASITINTTIV